ncbi:MAG: hypothetical protein HQL50_00990 [Magnetococcales bacterium]|nr:hypothetical protein [Magnetococcales bacterium]
MVTEAKTPHPAQNDDTLGEILQLLKEIPEISHDGFSNITDHMGNFSSSFATGATRSISITELIESDGDMGLTPLRNDLRKVNREISGAFKSLDTLVEQQQGFLTLINKTLEWALTLEQDAFLPPIVDQIKAQSGERLEIQTLGAIIDSLIQQTRPLIHDVIMASEEATDVMNHLSRRVTADLESSRHGLTGIKKKTSQGTRTLTRIVKDVGSICSAMHDRSRKVNDIVFQMVQSMQYDDITAQRVQHALQALETGRDKLTTEKPSTRDIQWFTVASTIIINQLHATRDDAVKAISDSREQLDLIAELAREQVSDVSTIRKHGVAFRQETADVTYHLTSMGHFSAFNERFSNDVLSDLTKAENAIFQAKRAMNVLAMTSNRLEKLASSLKTQGSERLEVLTRNIIALAQKIQIEGPKQVAAFNKASVKLHSISMTFSDKVTPKLMRTNSLLRRVPLTTKQLDSNNEDLISEMNETLGDAQATAIQIMLLVTEMDFHEEIHDHVETATRLLNRLLEDLGISPGSLSDKELAELTNEFEDLANMYTMESERRVHNAALDQGDGHADEDDDDGIELF